MAGSSQKLGLDHAAMFVAVDARGVRLLPAEPRAEPAAGGRQQRGEAGDAHASRRLPRQQDEARRKLCCSYPFLSPAPKHCFWSYRCM